ARYLVNVVDMPHEGNFIVPSVVNRGPLTIAISTGGASPALSKAIRKEIEKHYSNEFSLYLRFVETIRKRAMNKIPYAREREKFLRSLASDDMMQLLRKGGFRKARNRILTHLKSFK
ncbi:MAG: bifunctional precorrin-2 dehydrogenase/sirohydrochlorin ferrochelatase, partial [Nitrospirota bacterium]